MQRADERTHARGGEERGHAGKGEPADDVSIGRRSERGRLAEEGDGSGRKRKRDDSTGIGKTRKEGQERRIDVRARVV